MARRWRRGSAKPEHASEEGPFVSFTDLFIGILFLFLILVAALMLMHQAAVKRAEEEARRLQAQIEKLEAELASLAKLDVNHPPFRLAIVYNSYQRQQGPKTDWTYSRTVQVYRAPNGLCLENIILRNSLNTGWKEPLEPDAIPKAGSPLYARMGAPCALTASGESWNSASETGGVRRVASNLYSGSTVLHAKKGDKTVEMQYRVMGIYDDYYRR